MTNKLFANFRKVNPPFFEFIFLIFFNFCVIFPQTLFTIWGSYLYLKGIRSAWAPSKLPNQSYSDPASLFPKYRYLQ